MNEKNIFIVCLSCFLLLTISGCCTRAAVYNHGDGASRFGTNTMVVSKTFGGFYE